MHLTLSKQRGSDQGLGSCSPVIDGDDYALP
jgi:hypothetical protein